MPSFEPHGVSLEPFKLAASFDAARLTRKVSIVSSRVCPWDALMLQACLNQSVASVRFLATSASVNSLLSRGQALLWLICMAEGAG